MAFLIVVGAIVLVAGAMALFTALVATLVESAVPPIGQEMVIDGARIRYIDVGSGPTIVLVHGLAGTLRHFTYALVDRLQADHRVIAFDRPGCGYSIMAPGSGAGPRAQAAVVAAFMEALGLERPLVLGHSLGGSLALALALHHPGSVGGLALVAPLSHPPEDAPPPFRQLVIFSSSRRWLAAWLWAVPATLVSGTAAVSYVFAPDPVPKDFGARGGGFLTLLPRNFRGASAEMVATRDDLPAMVKAYPTLTLPVGILYGTQDQVLDYRLQGESLAAAVPGAVLELIEGGHMQPIVNPDRTAAFVRANAKSSVASKNVGREEACS